MRYPTVEEVLETHKQMIDVIGGSHGIRDYGAVESAVAQPALTFGARTCTLDCRRKQRRSASRSSAITRSLMVTSAWAMRP